MKNCSTKRWKFLLYFHHYFYTHGKCPSFRKDFSQENYDHLSKTVLVNSIGFITIVLKMQRFVSFVSKPCLLVPFHLTMLNKQLLKQDLETGKRRQTRKKTSFSIKTSASHSEPIERYVKSKTSNNTVGKTLPS